MGIVNIHILINEPVSPVNQVQAVQEQLIADHHRGEHPDGRKRRACPLCQLGK